jgi:hypothetical protein
MNNFRVVESSVDDSFPVLGIFAGGFAHSVLPLGAFGTYDVAARVAVAGIVAGVTSVLLFVLTKRWDARKERN